MRVCIRWLLRLVFRVRVTGEAHLLAAGPRLVVANCESALDGVLLSLFLPGDALVVTTPEMHAGLIPRLLMHWVRCLRIERAHFMAVKAIVRHVHKGGVAIIFPTGSVTTTGSPDRACDTATVIASRCGDDVVPVHITGSLYSRYALTSGHWPKYFFPRVTIAVHAPVRIARRVSSATPVRPNARRNRHERALALQRVMQDMQGSATDDRSLFSAFTDAVVLHGRQTHIIEDARRQSETYGQLLKVALALGRLVARETAAHETVGVLMPSVSTTLSLLLGLAAHGRVAAMLNYSAGVGSMQKACAAAGVRTLVTSRQFLAAMGLAGIAGDLPDVRVLNVEDLRAALTLTDKLWLAGYAQWFPRAALPAVDPRQPAVVLFTSGSEGLPKGVVLSHAALLANMTQMRAVIDFGPDDKYFSALPLFHTFGLVACALMPLMTGTPLFLYVSPLHYRVIPELVYVSNATYLFGTTTFLGHYARQAHAGDFRSLRKVICGGEKLSRDVDELWAEKFGLRILEGYGATECGPAMALNTPLAYKHGTVGRFLPGIEYRIVPVPGIATGGALHVRGPNLMSGYLHMAQPGVLVPPQSAAGRGWHDTGDVVTVDAEGFVTFDSRTRRFVKIAGEMVSLDVVERIAALASPRYQHAADSDLASGQGESTVLFTTDARLDRVTLLRAAREFGMPELAIARRIVVVDELPLLGNGKTDYAALGRRIAA